MPKSAQQQCRTRSCHLVSPANPDRTTLQAAHSADSPMTQQPVLGNQAAQQFAQACPLRLPFPIACTFGGICHTCPVQVQTKLKIGQPGDKCNQEAERVVEEVIRRPVPQEEALRRRIIEEEEEPLQATELHGNTVQIAKSPWATQVEPSTYKDLPSPGEGDSQLDPSVQASWQQLLSVPLGWIRIHASPKSGPALAEKGRVGETYNGIITVPKEAHPPKSTSAYSLLGHEVAHALQQVVAEGTATPPSQLEKEAEEASIALIQGRNFRIRGGANSGTLARALQISPRTQLGRISHCPETGARIDTLIFAERERAPEGEVPGAFEGFTAQSTAIRFATGGTRIVAIVRDLDGRFHAYETNATPYSESWTCEFIGFPGSDYVVTALANQPIGSPLTPGIEIAESRMTAHILRLLADNRLQPPDWDEIWRHATELGISEMSLSHLLISEVLNLESDSADLIAFLSSTDNPAIERFTRSFATNITPDLPRALETDPVSSFLARSLENQSMDLNEAVALRQFMQIVGLEFLDVVLEDSNLSNVTHASLLSILQMRSTDFQSLASTSGLFPITFHEQAPGVVGTTTDLRQRILRHFIQGGTCEHHSFGIIRTLLGNVGEAQATTLLQGAGLITQHARLLAIEFTRPERQYRHQVENRQLLTLSFRRAGERWALTAESYQNWSLPWHPGLIRPLAPPEGSAERRTYVPEYVTHLGDHRFASGLVRNAEQIAFTLLDRSIPTVIAEELVERDWSLLIRIETALSVLPIRHVALIQELAIDPGDDPGGATAEAFRATHTVNIYLRGAGPRVAQSELNNTTAHEVGHVVSYQAELTDTTLWSQWEQAMADDLIGISRYGFTNRGEDFAEAYVLYLSGGRSDESSRQRYSHRFAILDEIFRRLGE